MKNILNKNTFDLNYLFNTYKNIVFTEDIHKCVMKVPVQRM